MALNVLITGASRGMGLEFANQALERGDTVFAACRNPGQSLGLQALSKTYGRKLHAVPVDVINEDSIIKAALQVERVVGKLDLIINNAADPVDRTERIDNLQQEAMLFGFKVNAIGPILVVKNLLGLIKKGTAPKIINITSESGSLHNMDKFKNFYTYGAGKAAQNMFTRILSHELKEENIIVIAMHPGWVHTKEGNSKAPTEPPEAISAMFSVIDRLTISDSGKFLTYKGEEHPW